MTKFILLLCSNIFIIFCLLLFFIDNKLFTKEPFPIVRNLLLLIMALWISYNLITIYILKKEKQENGLVYQVASKTKKLSLAFHSYIQPFQKEFITWLLIATGLAFIGMILVGIPGYLWLAIPVKLGIVSEIKGDSAWPTALFISMVWPFLFPIGVLVKYHLIKMGYSNYAFPSFIGVLVGGIIALITVTYLLAGKTKT